MTYLLSKTCYEVHIEDSISKGIVPSISDCTVYSLHSDCTAHVTRCQDTHCAWRNNQILAMHYFQSSQLLSTKT